MEQTDRQTPGHYFMLYRYMDATSVRRSNSDCKTTLSKLNRNV